MNIYLEKIELQGFKSFPEKTVIRLHQGITAVVGPNGCGKSNIVDSIFWVLGEQRIKNLRGEVNEDLIFNGSVHLKPLGLAEVGAYFRRGEEQTYIARRFFRTGESKYILNEKYCRNRDIQDALYEMQLGERKYFIFEQGSIDKLISLKPSEKRLLIEEAAGILQYLDRKKEAAQKLLVAEQNLENLEVLGADKESRLKDLNNQVNYVRRYREIKERREIVLKTLLHRRQEELKNSFSEARNRLETLLDRGKSLSAEISRREKESRIDEEARWKLDRELKQNQQRVFDVKRNAQELRNDADKMEQRGHFLGERIEALRNQVEAARSEEKLLKEGERKAAGEIEKLEAQLAETRSDGDIILSRLEDLKTRLREDGSRSADSRDRFFQLQNESARVQNHIREMDKRMGRLDNEIETKGRFLTELEEQLNEREIQEAQDQLQAVSQREKAGREALEKETKRLDEARANLERLSQEEKDASGEIRDLEKQIERYEKIRIKLGGEQGDEPEVPVVGVLHDLIQADPSAHLWLENFYSEEMSASLLVENRDALRSGKRRVLLKRRSDDSVSDALCEDPGVVARIKDRFTVSSADFKETLRDGVLVRSLEDGIRLFEKFGISVVTEDGIVITREGVLIRNREKGILDVISEVRHARTRLKKCEETSRRLKAKCGDAQTLLNECREKRAVLEEKFQIARSEVTLWKTRLETLQKGRESGLERMERTRGEIALLGDELTVLKGEFESVDAQREELDKRIREERQAREEAAEKEKILSAEISRVEKESLQADNQVRLLSERLKSFQADAHRIRETLKKMERKRDADGAESERQKKEMSESAQKVTELRHEADIREKSREELEKNIHEQEAEFQVLSSRLREHTRELESIRKEQEEVREERGNLEVDVSSHRKDMTQLQDIAFQELNSDLEDLVPDPDWADTAIETLQEEADAVNLRMTRMRESNRLNFSAESEYELLFKEHEFLISQREDVLQSIHDLNEAIQKIDAESRDSFMAAFTEIKGNFLKNFQILFDGGEAEMSLSDPDDLLESGLEIRAQPPGKKLQSLRLLSGGEKTLTSLAFLFALFEYKPSPFCVFDEVDASLDEANIQRFLKFLHKLKDKTQFLIITHNFKTMEEADFIYGISMNEPGVSSVYSMKMTNRNTLQAEGRSS